MHEPLCVQAPAWPPSHARPLHHVCGENCTAATYVPDVKIDAVIAATKQPPSKFGYKPAANDDDGECGDRTMLAAAGTPKSLGEVAVSAYQKWNAPRGVK